MELSKRNIWALILIGLGLLIILNRFGLGLGPLMGWIIPLALIGLGYIGIKNNRSFFGWVLLIIGLISLLGKFAGLMGLIIAVALIWYGISILRKGGRAY
ncbi:hypothetical protein DUZ99_00920 [Xylanibacillus composti]|uniref:LiaF transmembrane domain-containing protein n=1 Tax=Xylanibacillus composti TaxID=1572762 RepID=A0A8J4H2S0_9BACL|nr:hypothetical protein [Xylanibacillus composti]MDT9723580.1 hypothetical protein [Xylanibacillus composti]GIQ68382.1 hypothetical protein XYCOK13_12060 [Xylanibacillus composti]